MGVKVRENLRFIVKIVVDGIVMRVDGRRQRWVKMVTNEGLIQSKRQFYFRMKTPEIMIIKFKMKSKDGGGRDGVQDSSEDSGG